MVAVESEGARAVLRELERVLASPGFTRNERISGFLRFLVERHLAGRAYELKESVLGAEVFGRSPDYDPKRDPIVRTEAGRLRSRLIEYYAREGRDDALVIDLPKGGYVPVFHQRAARPAGDPGRKPPDRRLAANHVGRETELAELSHCFDLAVRNCGSMVCLSGEPGIGKTMLAEAFLDRVSRQSQCHIAVGRCSERLAGTDAYLPILEALQDLLNSQSGEAASEVMKAVAPTWFAEMPQAGGLPDALPASSQERRKREFVSFLEALTRDCPLVLFVDDLHWADLSSTDLLSYVGSRCGSLPVMILATYRPSDLLLSRHPFREVKLELQARRLAKEIDLTSFRPQDVEAFIQVEFPSNGFPPGFADSVWKQTEGIPLFVSDILHHLNDAGLIACQGDSWGLTCPLPEIQNTLPDSVRGMVERKIGRLDARLRILSEAASVQGAEFHSAVLSRVTGINAAEVETALQDLAQSHRLARFEREEEFPDGTFTLRYAFSHALYQNALFAGIGPTRRAALSAEVAEALLAFHGGASGIASQLGYLFEAARKWERASEFFAAASENVARLSANREAAEFALRAIANAERIRGAARVRRVLHGTLQLAGARQALSDFPHAISDFLSAAGLAETLGDAETQVNALCGAAISAGYMKQMDRQHELGTTALRLSRSSGVSAAYAESVLAGAHIFSGDLTAARNYLGSAVPALQQTGPAHAAVFGCGNFGLLQHFQSEYRKAEAVLGWALEKVRTVGSSHDVLRIVWLQGMVQANQGRLAEALQTLREGMRLAELNGERYWFSRFPNTIGWLHGELADFDSALRLNTEGVRAGREAVTPETEANSHINLASTHLELGDHARAWSHLCEGERILKLEDHRDWLRWRFNIRLDLEMARYWIARTDAAQGQARAAEALARAERFQARKHMAGAHKLLGDLAFLTDRIADAAREYDTALAILKQYPCPLLEWKVLLSRAQVARCCKDLRRADDLFARSRATVARIADSVRDDRIKQEFLQSRVVRENLLG
jgi:tetratricopeptide (TPR) repeat protein